MESILTSIKKLLGIEESYEIFDPDIIMYINSVFSTLTQLGVGPEKGFSIKDKTTTWSEYLNNDPRLDLIKNYIFLKVKLIFDPPTSSSVQSAYERMIQELEWRILHAVEIMINKEGG